MPFHFSLQEVLDYRRRIEEMRQAEANEMRRRVEHLENLIGQARAQRMEYRRGLTVVVEQGKGFAYQQLYLDYLRGLDELIRRSEGHLEQLREELERRRRRLTEAARDRQVLDELLKEERKQYAISERRAEMKVFDEISIRQFLLSERERSAQGA